MDDFLEFCKILAQCCCFFILATIILCICFMPLNNIQCDNFNKLSNTNYSHEDWFFNSDAIKLKHATHINNKGE